MATTKIKHNGEWIYSSGLPGRTTTGVHVYSHDGSTQGEIGIDSTPTTESSNLITSAAVATELETITAVGCERYDGVDLTEKFATEIANYSDEWAWIKARITANNYSGLKIHDYIPITCTNGTILKQEIIGFDPYLHSGSPEITAHHIDFMSKDCWPSTVTWNPVNNNNGFGFTWTVAEGQTDFVCDTTATGRSGQTFTNYPYEINRVTVAGTEVSQSSSNGWTYDNTTGIVHFSGTAVPATGAIVIAQNAVPFFASNVYAYMNSLKTIVNNTTTNDGNLLDVDYSAGGIYYYLPQKLKNVISGKNAAWPTRYKSGTSLQSNDDNYKWLTSCPLWIPDEMEVYGTPMFSTGTYDKWFGRWYPGFMEGKARFKGSTNGGSRCTWWLSSVGSGSATLACYVNNFGSANTNSTSNSYLRVPVGFRITA